jgi:hypothetical protein
MPDTREDLTRYAARELRRAAVDLSNARDTLDGDGCRGALAAVSLASAAVYAVTCACNRARKNLHDALDLPVGGV